MPTRVTCPHCDAVFLPKSRVTPGNSIRCPECDRRFVPLEEDEDDPAGRLRRRDPDGRRARPDTGRVSSRRKWKKKASPLLFILPAAGVLGLSFLAVVLYVTVFRDRERSVSDGGGPKIENEMFAQLPDQVFSVHYIELETVLNHPGLPEPIRRDILGSQERALRGIPPAEVSAYVFGRGTREATVLRLKNQPLDQNRIIGLTRGRAVTYQGQNFYKTNNGLMQFPADGLVKFVPDTFSMPRAPMPRFGDYGFPPAMYSKVKGPIWKGSGAGKAGGSSSGPEGERRWEFRVQWSYTNVTLGDDFVEEVKVTECADNGGAATLETEEENRRQAQERKEVTRSGTTVTVRRVRPIEQAEEFLRAAIPPG